MRYLKYDANINLWIARKGHKTRLCKTVKQAIDFLVR